MASQALMWERKALPSPWPSEAPFTRPAMSVTLRNAGTLLKEIQGIKSLHLSFSLQCLVVQFKRASTAHFPPLFPAKLTDGRVIEGGWIRRRKIGFSASPLSISLPLSVSQSSWPLLILICTRPIGTDLILSFSIWRIWIQERARQLDYSTIFRVLHRIE